MDPQVSASFIPKKPLADSRPRGGGGGGLFSLLGLLFFIASLVAGGGAFLYERYLNSTLENQKIALQKSQEAYDLPTIQALIRFDSRINEAKKTLIGHLSPSAIFTFLSQQTLEKVQFTDFHYDVGAGEHGTTISMSGLTDKFETIALQSDQLGKNPALKNIIFSDIGIKEGGKVGFTVKADVDSALILYSNSFNTTPTSALVPIEASTTPQSVPTQ
jgi:hypothetical protein